MDAEKNQGKIRLCYWGYAEGNPSIRIKMHVHDFFQANFTLSGKCELITENGSCPVQENDLLFVAPGTPHILKYSEKYLSLCYKFYMEQPVFPPFLHVAANDFTRGVIDATKTIFETTFPSRFFGVPEGTIILPQDRYQILMEYYLTGVVATLFQHSQRYSGPLARIYDILEKQERCPFSVTEAAEACHYSRNHFSVLIRRMTGLTAKDFLNQLRVESAKRYLRYSDKNIGEIAAIMGFSSQFHFSDFFKRMTGSSPLHYKKELLQQATANKLP